MESREHQMRTGAIGLLVSDLDRMVEFYSRLGFVEENRILRDEDWAGDIIGIEGAAFERALLLHRTNLCSIEMLRLIRPDPWRWSLGVPGNYVTIWTDDIEHAQRTAFAAGGRIVSSHIVVIPRGPEEGVKVCRVADPEGNTIEFREAAKKGRIYEFGTFSTSTLETEDPVP